jgi:hypothetical protein
VPEVGEWARYEYASCRTNNIGEEFETTHESKGTMLLKCVGEETIDDQRYLWLEQRQEEIRASGSEFWIVTKILVPEEGLVDATFNVENIRGWQWRMRDEVKPLDLFTTEMKEPESANLPVFLNSFPTATTGRMEERMLVVDDVEVELSYVEGTDLPSLEAGNGVLTGHLEWWTDDDLAFGIASVHQTVFRTDFGKASADSRYDIRYDLVATGTDAVSELPEHN